jgi:GDPmannose 4,6-dehydratase
MKTALVTGITGQDGYYLAKFLLNKGYEVYGMYRRSSTDILERLDEKLKGVKLVEGDLSDPTSIARILREIEPSEVYNLGAQSFVPASWSQPLATAQITGLGVLNILESIKQVDKNIRFYQASTSEMFGKVSESPQNEDTSFHPRSPYGVSKVFAYWITVNYRESYGIHASNGILFNHESPKRGREFVTRKITHAVASIKLELQDCLEIGNMEAQRDWGYAGDYVEAMWAMLQQDRPDDYVISSGRTHSVREFVEKAFAAVDMDIKWEGEGIDEVGRVNGKIVVKVNSKFYRPAEVDFLLGNPKKAIDKLGWNPTKTKFEELVRMMVENDMKELVGHGLRDADRTT